MKFCVDVPDLILKSGEKFKTKWQIILRSVTHRNCITCTHTKKEKSLFNTTHILK